MTEPPRQKWTARALLLIFALAGLAWLAHLDLARKVTTDILELVPADERSPELTMVRTLAGEEEARVLLLAVSVDAMPGESDAARARRADRAAAVLGANLKSSAIGAAILLSDTGPRDAMGAAVFFRRFELLLPGWMAEKRREYSAARSPGPFDSWLAERTAADLEAYLSRPEAMATQSLLTQDPLLLISGLVARLGSLSDTGLAAGRSGDHVLIWAQSRASPLTPEGQEPVFAVIDAALATARIVEPGTQLLWTGVARFAAASRARIEHEVSTLNLLSLVLVVLVAALCVRRVYRALQLVPVVLGSLLGAWVATTMSFGRVHILVFVVGSLLAGVAVDYGFYLYLQPRRRPDEPYRERAGRLIRPLLASALTTVIGFSFLLWSELPMIRQLGVFVSAGLICALGTALLWFAQLDNSTLETRDFIRHRYSGRSPAVRRFARVALTVGALVALVGPWRLHWRDDIRELQIPTPAIQENDAAVRALFGETAGRKVYLTRGATVAEARERLEAFLAWHQQAFPTAKAASIGYAFPTEEQWQQLPEDLQTLIESEGQLRAALTAHGFDAASFGPYFAALEAARKRSPALTYQGLAEELSSGLHGPISSLLHVGHGASWFATISEEGPGPEPPVALATVTDSQLQNLNHLFTRYRESALRLSSVGLAFVGASVFALYGLRRGVRIFAIPAGACLFAFGVFGLAGATLNLFNLLGAFLGVCLSHNYAIFSAESRGRGEEPPPSIRMSAVAAASSFGVLALSRIPVVSALGATVAVIVLAALAITELTPLASGDGPGQSPGA